MAKLTRTLSGNLNSLMHKIKDGILEGSATATLEEVCTFEEKGARCGVMVFERYSYKGNNRVSMNVTLFQSGDGPVHLCAITSGGSQAMFYKINTWGEESFLSKLEEIL